MTEPNWIPESIIHSIHNDLLDRFGGSNGIRDQGLLDSALNRPQQLFHYGAPTLFDMAAAYTEGIVKNHPFIDGNKRTGFMAAYVFLGANDYELEATETEAVLETLALAAGESDLETFAAWLEKNSEPIV